MTITDEALDSLVAIVAEAAAAEIMPRFRKLGAADIAEKTSALDLVTQADLLTEQRITAALKARYPQALIVGEEAYEADRSVVPALATADLAFVIDPVDGTYNFASGLPLFGSILAVVANGETIAGIVHDPILGDTIMAARGAGSYLRRKDGEAVRLRVAPAMPLGDMTGIMAWSDIREPERSRIAGNMAKTRMMFSFNCSAYEYWMVTSGRVHFIGHSKLMPWDHLAGVLAHREAGGHSARFDGSPYRPGETAGGIICAPDAESWTMIRRDILGY